MKGGDIMKTKLILDEYVLPMRNDAQETLFINGDIDGTDINILVQKYRDIAMISFNAGSIDVNELADIMFAIGSTATLLSKECGLI